MGRRIVQKMSGHMLRSRGRSRRSPSRGSRTRASAFGNDVTTRGKRVIAFCTSLTTFGRRAITFGKRGIPFGNQVIAFEKVCRRARRHVIRFRAWSELALLQ